MAKVRAKMDCFVDNCFRREGDVFEYNGPASDVFERVGAPAVEHDEVFEDQPVEVERPRRGRPRKAVTDGM